MRRGSVRIGIHRHLTIRSSRPHVVASATCYALRLHVSAAPLRGGLTQALGLTRRLMQFAKEICLALAVACAATGCGGGTQSSAAADSVAQCAARGVTYFKEIGSYPTLSSAPNAGRLAEDVAIERCQRTLTAF